MEAPSESLDISLSFGRDQNIQNLMNFDISIQQGEEHVKNFAQQSKIQIKEDSDILYLSFDFYVQQGKQQQAIQYFKYGQQHKGQEDLSPLQRAFRYKGNAQGDHACIISHIESHQGFVRIYYQILNKQGVQYEYKQGLEDLQPFFNSSVDITSYLTLDLKGSVAHNKKNRQNVKVDYAKFQLQSSKLFGSQLLDFLLSVQAIDHNEVQYYNPYIDLLKKSKQTKMNLKFDSFRKINRYYQQQLPNQDKNSQTKGFPYTNKGIFRQKAQFRLIFKKYTARITGTYQSQDVFIRLIKVYGKALNKIFDTDILYR